MEEAHQLSLDSNIHMHEHNAVCVFLLKVFQRLLPELFVDVYHADLHVCNDIELQHALVSGDMIRKQALEEGELCNANSGNWAVKELSYSGVHDAQGLTKRCRNQ